MLWYYLILPPLACSKRFIQSTNIASRKRYEKRPIKNNIKIRIVNKPTSLRFKSLNATKDNILTLPKKTLLYVQRVYTAPSTILVEAKKVAQKLY